MKDTASEVITLNERIRAGSIFYGNHAGKSNAEDLYRNLEHFGFARTDVVILSICPDGDDTVTGCFATRAAEIYYFDFDLDDLSYSTLEKGQLSVRPGNFPETIIEAAVRWLKD